MISCDEILHVLAPKPARTFRLLVGWPVRWFSWNSRLIDSLLYETTVKKFHEKPTKCLAPILSHEEMQTEGQTWSPKKAFSRSYLLSYAKYTYVYLFIRSKLTATLVT